LRGIDSLFTAVAPDTAGRLVAVHTDHPYCLHSPAWSPDGRLLAYVNGNCQWLNGFTNLPSSIWVVSSSGGTPQRITPDEGLNVSPVWLDARHLLFVSDRDGARGAYVVAAGPDGARGEPRIIPGIADPHSISYSAATRTLAFAKFNLRQNVWAYPIGGPRPVSIGSGARITTGNQVIEGFDVSPDGTWLAFHAKRRGNANLYKVPLAGGDAVQLTDLPGNEFFPQWSPDGSEIAFSTGPLSGGGRSALMVLSSRGGTPVALAPRLTNSGFTAWSPDGLHIAFQLDDSLPGAAGVVSRDSVGAPWREAVRLADFPLSPIDWAPDGSGVLGTWASSLLMSVSLQGRPLWRRDLAATRGPGALALSACGYARDGGTVFCSASRDGRQGIWAIPVPGGEARLVVAADDPALELGAVLVVGPDRLYTTVYEYESDVWVARLRY
jgi:dipeptidyl aminopeptidase/acylaminoacyl peptidase